MQTERNKLRALTPSERGLAVAFGVGMILLSLVALAATVALCLPFSTLTENLSK
jgi:hypothetical protein